jgi:hypothetical protein
MRNAQQVRELLDVIEEQRDIVDRYAGELYTDRQDEELEKLLDLYGELEYLIEQELES